MLQPDEPELFLDDHLIAATENLRAKIHPVQRPEEKPVIRPDRPWEEPHDRTLYPSVIVDAESGRFRMYYGTGKRDPMVCYAESDDGVHWTKPELGLHSCDGHQGTNILLPDVDFLYVIANPDPDAPDDERYLGFGRRRFRPEGAKPYNRSLGFASGDGVHWREIMDTQTCKDCYPSVVWCPGDRRFRAYVRDWRLHEKYRETVWWRDERYAKQRKTQFRQVSMVESPDFRTWSSPKVVLETDEEDGAPLVQVYGLSVSRLGGVFIGALSVLYADPAIEGWQRGHQDIQLVVSRDGVHWSRVGGRSAFIPHGPEGAFDWGEAYFPAGVFTHGDTTYCYYSAKATLHKGPGTYSIGLATLPRDRIMSLSQEDATRPATLETTSFEIAGNQLLVNVTGEGTAQVEVLHADGSPVTEAGTSAGQLQTHDAIYRRVTWQGEGKSLDLSDLLQEPEASIRLRFRLEGATLHAFKVV